MMLQFAPVLQEGGAALGLLGGSLLLIGLLAVVFGFLPMIAAGYFIVSNSTETPFLWLAIVLASGLFFPLIGPIAVAILFYFVED